MSLIMPQSQRPWRLADESKSPDFEGFRPSTELVKNRSGISVEVMKASKNEGVPADGSSGQLGKNLPGVYQASAGHR